MYTYTKCWRPRCRGRRHHRNTRVLLMNSLMFSFCICGVFLYSFDFTLVDAGTSHQTNYSSENKTSKSLNTYTTYEFFSTRRAVYSV